MQRKAEEKERKLKAGNLEPQNLKQETGEILRGISRITQGNRRNTRGNIQKHHGKW